MPRYIDAEALINELKRLKDFWGFTFTADGVDEAIDKVEEAPTAEVIVLPCKIGDPIYRVCSPKGVRQQPSVRKFKLTWNNLRKTIEDFGTLVFLTEEEAERVANGREKAD